MNQRANEHVLVHAPYGRDAALICQVFESAGIASSVCPTVERLCMSLGDDTGAALISDESLTREHVSALADIIDAQAPWSDLPLIVTTSGGEATAASKMRLRLLEPLGNISLLERPLRKVTLVSAVQIALRARRRQYQLRENFSERERLVKELERSNEELAQFSHIVSHDLQAPIRMVKSFSQLLMRRYQGRLDAEADKFIHAIEDGASTMQELVQTLLHYATVGQEPIARMEVDLTSIIEAVTVILQPNIEELGASISYEALPTAYGDRLQLQQLIQNLVANALKYGKPETAPVVRIFAEQSDYECKVSVMDNGRGIAAEYHERIFQPLKRLHGHEISGTGMGLAVCRKIVERHGGKIWVNSVIGQGSTFSFTLPNANSSSNIHFRASEAT
jgi:signal transduction histidine kinase